MEPLSRACCRRSCASAEADTYHQLGMLAQARGDYDEAARQYQRSLDIRERLGDQAGMAGTYHQLGMLAQDRGDYDEAARQYQRSLDINERLGNQADVATTYSQMAFLEAERGGSAEQAITWNVQALGIRLRLRLPQAVINLHRLTGYRDQLGSERFGSLLAQATGDADQAEMILSVLTQLRPDDTDGG
jgi:tetratricopeptide (TPR) repeat protein